MRPTQVLEYASKYTFSDHCLYVFCIFRRSQLTSEFPVFTKLCTSAVGISIIIVNLRTANLNPGTRKVRYTGTYACAASLRNIPGYLRPHLSVRRCAKNLPVVPCDSLTTAYTHSTIQTRVISVRGFCIYLTSFGNRSVLFLNPRSK